MVSCESRPSRRAVPAHAMTKAGGEGCYAKPDGSCLPPVSSDGPRGRWRTPLPNNTAHRRRLDRAVLGCLFAFGITGSALASGPSPLGRPAAPRPAPSPARPAAPAPAPAPAQAPAAGASAPTSQPMPPAVHAPTILPNQKTGAPAPGVVDRYVKTEVALLAHPDPAVQKEARKRIDDALAAPVGSTSTSVEYQTEFARSLNAALLPLFKNPEMRVRLNAAIVLQHAAEKFDNVLLAPAATAAISDSALPVVIWGVKAARNLV